MRGVIPEALFRDVLRAGTAWRKDVKSHIARRREIAIVLPFERAELRLSGAEWAMRRGSYLRMLASAHRVTTGARIHARRAVRERDHRGQAALCRDVNDDPRNVRVVRRREGQTVGDRIEHEAT
jgi:hypothetical protein